MGYSQHFDSIFIISIQNNMNCNRQAHKYKLNYWY